MHSSRRTFVKTGVLAVAGTALFQKLAFANGKTGTLTGMQLYCVREDMKKDPAGTLRKLAEMGYTHVEHANYVDHKFYGYAAKDFRQLLDSLGLKMPSGHTVMNAQHWDESKKIFTDQWKQTVEDAAILGQQFVISPSLDETWRKEYDTLLRYMEVFNKSGELCKASGMKFGYHNHNFEFSERLNGQRLYDLILQHTEPSLVMHQLDIGNMYSGGGRPLEVIQQFPGRFASMHVKDEIASTTEKEGYESTILGKGIIETRKVIEAGIKNGGTTHLIIEQESYQGKTALDCVREDLQIMKSWGY